MWLFSFFSRNKVVFTEGDHISKAVDLIFKESLTVDRIICDNRVPSKGNVLTRYTLNCSQSGAAWGKIILWRPIVGNSMELLGYLTELKDIANRTQYAREILRMFWKEPRRKPVVDLPVTEEDLKMLQELEADEDDLKDCVSPAYKRVEGPKASDD